MQMVSDSKKLPIGKPFEKGNQFAWSSGKSGNPSGRSKLDKLVRDAVGNDMPAMIRAQVAIAKGEKPTKPDGTVIDIPAIKAADMTKAFEAVTDRGWGKPKQTVDIGNGSSRSLEDLAKMTNEELEEALEKAEAEADDLEAADRAEAEGTDDVARESGSGAPQG